MNAKYVFIYDSCDWEKVEHISEQLPNYSIPIFVLALHIKAIILSDGSELVVPSYQQYFGRIFEFQETEKSYCLNAMGSSIDVVS